MVTCNICNKESETYKELSKHLVQEHNFSTTQLYSYYNYSFERDRDRLVLSMEEHVLDE